MTATFIEAFYEPFSPALKKPGVLPHPLWSALSLLNQLLFGFGKCGRWEGVVSCTGWSRISRGGRSEMDRDPEGQSRWYDMTSLQTVPCHIASMEALTWGKKKLFPTVQ